MDWIALLTAVLVVVTGYYAWQTRQTVIEMRAARGAAIRPHLVTRWRVVGPMAAHPRIENVGSGPALAVDVEMSFEPGHGLSRRWRTAVLTAGDGADFLVRDETQQAIYDVGKLAERFEHIRLVGTYRDALGAEHRVDGLMEIRETWELARSAAVLLPPDHVREAVRHLERMARSVERTENRQQRREWALDVEDEPERDVQPGESSPSKAREP